MSGTLNESFCILNKVLREGAYVNLALNEDAVGAMARRIVLGVLERYYKLNYMISRLVPKAPKAVVRIVLMQGIYCLTETEMPRYAVVDESVKLTGAIGKKELKGLVNAVLQRVADGERPLPDKQDPAYEEVELNAPRWLIQMLKKEYPKAYKRILKGDETHLEHIRLRRGEDAKLWENAPGVIARTATGFFVRPDEGIRTAFSEGRLTYQSLTSTYAVLAAGAVEGKRVLDLCAAPGGKSVFYAERGAVVTASEKYPHRADLIRAYAGRMGVRLSAITLSDATVLRPDFVGQFDIVAVDAPCSGLGVLAKRQDAVLRKKPEDIDELGLLQSKILAVAAQYVKAGGILLYTTCTVTAKENGEQIAAFLAAHKEFALDKIPLPYDNEGELQFLPDGKGLDGFYIARMKRFG